VVDHPEEVEGIWVAVCLEEAEVGWVAGVDLEVGLAPRCLESKRSG